MSNQKKAVIVVWILLVIVLIACACVAKESDRPLVQDVSDSAVAGSDNISQEAELLPELDASDFTSPEEPASQKRVKLEQAVSALSSEYDSVKVWDWAPYATVCRRAGTRKGVLQREDGTRSLGEVPNEQYWIVLSDGSFLSDEPFDACIDYMGAPEGEVYCVRDGCGYRYAVQAGSGSFSLIEASEPELLDEDFYGYRLSTYRWDSREPCYGIVDANGTEVIAPIYERVEIPFSDRFLLYDGGASQGAIMGRCRMTDENGNTICDCFHCIDYSVFDSGYVGIAVCYGERATYPCFDENGQPMEAGYWLIDRDGNICSERFESLAFQDGTTHAQSEDDVLCAQREDGTQERLPLSELLLTLG